jgi:hypothetical protein
MVLDIYTGEQSRLLHLPPPFFRKYSPGANPESARNLEGESRSGNLPPLHGKRPRSVIRSSWSVLSAAGYGSNGRRASSDRDED